MNRKYKTMLQRMKQKENSTRRRARERWFLYILQCSDGSLYTGITKDVARRLARHNAGLASRYTRTRRPVVVCYQEACCGRTQSLIRECAVKALPRKKKEALIQAYQKRARKRGEKKRGRLVLLKYT